MSEAVTETLLRISAPHFVAGAVWKNQGGHWVCTEAAPILSWMIGKEPQKVKQYLVKKCWSFEWLEVSVPLV